MDYLHDFRNALSAGHLRFLREDELQYRRRLERGSLYSGHHNRYHHHNPLIDPAGTRGPYPLMIQIPYLAHPDRCKGAGTAFEAAIPSIADLLFGTSAGKDAQPFIESKRSITAHNHLELQVPDFWALIVDPCTFS